MLKKITTEQVCLGMYIHGLEGSWLSHPFWKSKFVLDDPTDLRALIARGRDPRYLVPDSVCKLLRETGWYAGGQ